MRNREIRDADFPLYPRFSYPHPDSGVTGNCTSTPLSDHSLLSCQLTPCNTPMPALASTPMGGLATLLFSNQPGMFPPRGLCICSSLYPECLLPQCLHGFLVCSFGFYLNLTTSYKIAHCAPSSITLFLSLFFCTAL